MNGNAVSVNRTAYSGVPNFDANGDINVDAAPDVDFRIQGRTWYSLPTFRFVNVVQTILLLDAVVSIVLWLTGGNSLYFVDSIVQFHLTESVFDLAVLGACKATVIVSFYHCLEETMLKNIQHPLQRSFKRNARVFHTSVVFLSFAFLAFSATKGGLVLYSILQDPSYPGMHSTYYALVVSAACFSLLEFFMCLWSFVALRKLESIRVIHRVNAKGEELDEEGKPVEKDVDIIRLITLAKPESGLICFGLIGLLGQSVGSILSPMFFGRVVDAAKQDMDALDLTVVTVLGIYILGSICSMAKGCLFTLAGHRMVARLRMKLFDAIIRQEVAFFDQNRTGELCNRLSSDTQVIQNCLTVNVAMLAKNSLQIIGSLSLMFYLKSSLTGVLLAVMPVISVGAVHYGKYMKKCRRLFQDHLGEAGSQAEESLSCIRTVRMFSAEEKARDEYKHYIDQSYSIGKKIAVVEGGYMGVVGMAVQGGVLLVLWYGGKLLHDNTLDPSTGISAGVLASFLMYTLSVSMCFGVLSSVLGDFMQAVGASGRIFTLMDRLPEIDTEEGLAPITLEGEIEFKNVDFSYPNRPEAKVLKNLSFSVFPGQMVALVGPSGGGKSTIVTMIERFYDPQKGAIFLGGHDLKTLDPSWFRRKIAMVSQEPTLFACSIRDNITYGRLASDKEVMEAAKQANAHNFIMTFDDGYDTLVGERGMSLSGGQKQRIAIARALIMDPVILLLDEATSALDAESEHLVQEAIDRAMKGRTVIVIAHRLSTVQNAHKVMVIDQGHIAEHGTHLELMLKNGVYKRLVLRQLMASDNKSEIRREQNM
ncbi:ABC transporter B family member 1-like [Haliotis rufescens]|uniref:ABC transporter B family member 1-like n=1 Tax=Haliotis rufescens TaxID=6454 RepID=UPI00201EDAAE|nr:ABC transporter B family member 1-like [Haliotis rufescens]